MFAESWRHPGRVLGDYDAGKRPGSDDDPAQTVEEREAWRDFSAAFR
ncbi:MAG: hypothetical protein HY724_04475 [Candidatus Rokubacteria bacterium]|nr:hypothetical protein [Candidatus Rokubacteria bacterium]